MDKTKRTSLSLGRARRKSHASPQSHLHKQSLGQYINATSKPRSPSVISVSSDAGIGSTPPHCKENPDDSIEYSPKIFDSSFSPSQFQSQTLPIDSPEVGWKWSQKSEKVAELSTPTSTTSKTPDSAYSAKSGLTSAECSSAESVGSYKRRQPRGVAYQFRRKDKQKILDMEIRRAEKARADEKLKQRCARLEEQLEKVKTEKKEKTTSEAESCEMKDIEISLPKDSQENIKNIIKDGFNKDVAIGFEMSEEFLNIDNPLIENSDKSNSLNQFWNDSASDDFLLEATEQVELKIVELTQKSEEAENLLKNTTSHKASENLGKNKNQNFAEKKSPLYMKFLDDDSPDDWFLSLDEVSLQSAHTKSKAVFQRYKSMPVKTSNDGCNYDSSSGTALYFKKNSTSNDRKSSLSLRSDSTNRVSKMKRHSSTHCISPSGSNYLRQEQHLRK